MDGRTIHLDAGRAGHAPGVRRANIPSQCPGLWAPIHTTAVAVGVGEWDGFLFVQRGPAVT